ncbi:hypothetical protein [Calidifontibacillus oryziterrae]|uniref:hypothetical protein n=1 Tax=Calidifontibacillus oryziterrae TaxID=1191699 RepID=UPI0002F75257|nr:hypothetical protein [Calidifontibacillus oryziterrae]
MRKLLIILLTLFILALTACGQKEQRTIELQPYTLAELSKIDLTKISKITINSNETGEKKTITDKTVIKTWVENMNVAYFIPDVVQEKNTTDWTYDLTLYEGNKKVFHFLPNYIDDIYFKPDEKVMKSIEDLYNS